MTQRRSVLLAAWLRLVLAMVLAMAVGVSAGCGASARLPAGCTIRPDPTTHEGCITPRMKAVVDAAEKAGYGTPVCYGDRESNPSSDHPKGRACDWTMGTIGVKASGAAKVRGKAFAQWVIGKASSLHVRYVIWFDRIWRPKTGWDAYKSLTGNNPTGRHQDHVHVSVSG